MPTNPGSAELSNAERQWRYTPQTAWPATRQTIQIDTALEDLAGNKVGRPFDVDTFDRVTVRTNRGQVTLARPTALKSLASVCSLPSSSFHLIATPQHPLLQGDRGAASPPHDRHHRRQRLWQDDDR
ncbi:MAG: hypothetical protein IPP47_23000 [Bryobacterales bacterium]|nr:hypothetical protein [Bryobacterales bacterium]